MPPPRRRLRDDDTGDIDLVLLIRASQSWIALALSLTPTAGEWEESTTPEADPKVFGTPNTTPSLERGSLIHPGGGRGGDGVGGGSLGVVSFSGGGTIRSRGEPPVPVDMVIVVVVVDDFGFRGRGPLDGEGATRADVRESS